MREAKNSKILNLKMDILKQMCRDVYRYKIPTADGTPEYLVQITASCNFSNCAGGRVQEMITHAWFPAKLDPSLH
jgi:hypothetical protein